MIKILTFTCLALFYVSNLFAQSNCTPISEVNFPGGRVIMSFDGNVHDDDDILALPYAAGLWWAAGLKDKVVQVEYNNHVCLINNNETDGSGPGAGDDSQNMRNSAAGAISRFNYNANIFYDYETQGNASTSKMASEIEKSTASNPLWIIAGGPMETVWRGLQRASKGHDHVTVISHSAWNEGHLHCGDDHNWTDLKNTFQNRGVYFVGFCSGSGCSQPNGLNDQNGGFSSAVSNWTWMQNSTKEYNRWIFGRNPFGTNKFDPSDAGMSYFLITGGPFNGGDKTPDHNDARKLMENPCEGNVPSVENIPPSLTITGPVSGSVVSVGSTITVSLSATDEDGFISKHQIFVNGTLVDTDGSNYTPHKISNITAGTYNIKATVTDNVGATTTKTVSITAGNSPTSPPPPAPADEDLSVTITSPIDGEDFNPGTSVYVNLTTDAPGGSISKHQIYVNNKLVDTDGSNYTAHKISSISEGSHTIKAVVTDSNGNIASSTVTIHAGTGTSSGENEKSDPDPPSEGSAPTVVFNTPLDLQEVATGSTVSISVTANDPDGSIVKHQIYVNGKLVDTDGSNFTPHKILGISEGSHIIKATVTDNSGEKATANITILATDDPNSGSGETNESPSSGNSLPTVTILAPLKNQNFNVGETVSVKLAAADSDGNVVKHQIYVNGKLVDTDGTFFTPHKITNVKSGSYTIKATVTDNEGGTASQTTTFNVGASTQKQAAIATRTYDELYVFDKITGKVDLKEELPYITIERNPVQEGILHIRQKGSTYLKIINLSGIVVKAMAITNEKHEIDLSGLAPGLYILKSDISTSKFILD